MSKDKNASIDNMPDEILAYAYLNTPTQHYVSHGAWRSNGEENAMKYLDDNIVGDISREYIKKSIHDEVVEEKEERLRVAYQKTKEYNAILDSGILSESVSKKDLQELIYYGDTPEDIVDRLQNLINKEGE